jgi:hypothetical protein
MTIKQPITDAIEAQGKESRRSNLVLNNKQEAAAEALKMLSGPRDKTIRQGGSPPG